MQLTHKGWKTHRDHELKMVVAVTVEMEMELLMPAKCKCILLGHSNDHHDDNDHNDAAFDDGPEPMTRCLEERSGRFQ